MAEAELIEQLRAQVQSLKSPRQSTRNNTSSGSSSRGRVTSNTLEAFSVGTFKNSSPNEYGESETSMIVDVGGVKYRTTKSTLSCVEASYFSQILEGDKDSPRTEEGHLFIDRNGELFGYVLEFLRGYVHGDTECIDLPAEGRKLRALIRESEFYRLPDLTSLISHAIRTRDRKEDSENESNSSVIIKDDAFLTEKELDVVFHSVSSPHCHFAEDRVQELVGRVNYQLSIKQSEGFKIKSTSSDVVFDPSKSTPYTMFMHVVLERERLSGSQASYSPREPTKPAASHFGYSSSVNHQAVNYIPSCEFMPSHYGRQAISLSPRRTRQYSRPPDGLSESIYGSMEYRHDSGRHRKSSHRPKHVDNYDCDYDRDVPVPVSPRSHYSIQRKFSSKSTARTQANVVYGLRLVG